MWRDNPLAPLSNKCKRSTNKWDNTFIYRREYASWQQASQFAVKMSDVVEITKESSLRGTVVPIHKRGSYFRILFINLQRIRVHHIHRGEDREIREHQLTAEHRTMIHEAWEYVRNLSRDINRIYGYLAQVLIAKAQGKRLEYSVIAVDSYPTMVINEKEPADTWRRKDTQSPPETTCDTRIVGEALAHSIIRMIRQATPETRTAPSTPTEEEMSQVEHNMGDKQDDMDTNTAEPWLGIIWRDGVKTSVSRGKTQPAGPLLHENKRMEINANEKLAGGKKRKTSEQTTTGPTPQ